MLPPIPWKYALPLFGLATSAFMFNTSEFMPIGLLSDIAASFEMTPAQTGIMITVYAWMVGLLSLPLMLAACRMDLRYLLLAGRYLPMALALSWCYDAGSSVWTAVLLHMAVNGLALLRAVGG